MSSHTPFVTKYNIFRYGFSEAVTAFNTTRAGRSEDGKGVIKAIINGPDVED